MSDWRLMLDSYINYIYGYDLLDHDLKSIHSMIVKESYVFFLVAKLELSVKRQEWNIQKKNFKTYTADSFCTHSIDLPGDPPPHQQRQNNQHPKLSPQ